MFVVDVVVVAVVVDESLLLLQLLLGERRRGRGRRRRRRRRRGFIAFRIAQYHHMVRGSGSIEAVFGSHIFKFSGERLNIPC